MFSGFVIVLGMLLEHILVFHVTVAVFAVHRTCVVCVCVCREVRVFLYTARCLREIKDIVRPMLNHM